MLYKVLVIPYVRHRGKLRYLFVHDRMYKEWTFVSGGCKVTESASECAKRELMEETKNLIHITEQELKTSISYKIMTRDKSLSTTYTIFVVEIHLTPSEVYTIENTFLHRSMYSQGDFCREMNENDNLLFMELEEALEYPNVWGFIKEVIYSTRFQTATNTISNTQNTQDMRTMQVLPVASATV